MSLCNTLRHLIDVSSAHETNIKIVRYIVLNLRFCKDKNESSRYNYGTPTLMWIDAAQVRKLKILRARLVYNNNRSWHVFVVAEALSKLYPTYHAQI